MIEYALELTDYLLEFQDQYCNHVEPTGRWDANQIELTYKTEKSFEMYTAMMKSPKGFNERFRGLRFNLSKSDTQNSLILTFTKIVE